MNVKTKKVIEENIDDFISQPAIQEALAYLTDAFPNSAVIYLVGGALRNLIFEVFHGQRPPIDDIDLFVGGVANDKHLTEILPDANFIPTDLAGVRWKPPGSSYDIDICLMQDFIIIKKYGLAPRLEDLLDTVDFTMNAVAFNIQNRRLYERNALAHIKKQVMAFNTRKLYTKTTIAYRTLFLRYKTGFTLSQDVFDFVKQAIDLETLTAVRQILNTRFGKIKSREILADYDRICSFGSYNEYRIYYETQRSQA